MNHVTNFYVNEDFSFSGSALVGSKWASLHAGDTIHQGVIRNYCSLTYEQAALRLTEIFGKPVSSDSIYSFIETLKEHPEGVQTMSYTFANDSWYVTMSYTTNYNNKTPLLSVSYATILPYEVHAPTLVQIQGLMLEKDPVTPKGTVYMLMMSQNGPSFRALPNRVETEFIRENYEPNVLEGFDRIKSDAESPKPHGRIGILDGPPGTGKTHLVRGLLTSIDGDKASFIFVSPKDVPHLADPSFLPALISFFSSKDKKSIIFVVEDADECLAPRGADNISAISAVLNLGDGILGELLDIRMIMTTNAKRQEFDSAITRPGRLSACVKVDKLSKERANEVFKRLTGKDGEFTSSMTLAEVYSKASDVGFVSVSKEKTIGF